MYIRKEDKMHESVPDIQTTEKGFRTKHVEYVIQGVLVAKEERTRAKARRAKENKSISKQIEIIKDNLGLSQESGDDLQAWILAKRNRLYDAMKEEKGV